MILTISFIFVWVGASFAGDSAVISDFEGKSLIAMGTILNNPLLKLLGRTFDKLEEDVKQDANNKTTLVLEQLKKDKSLSEQRLRNELIDIICQLHPCAEWGDWTNCSTETVGTYGVQTRYRKCGENASPRCSQTSQERNETDTRICEGMTECPYDYVRSTNGFCLRVYKESKSWTTARATCRQDGGYLINIDSELKSADVNSALRKMSLFYYDMWIDGTRALPGGEWRYEYGTRDTAYKNWSSGEPGSSDDCRVYYLAYSFSFSGQLVGKPCSSSAYFICEVV